MVIGIILIVAGILIAVYPPLLSLIVASILIFSGLVLAYMGFIFRKHAKTFGDPFVDFFLRM
jgi:Flp pilus assembly protein TadB